MFWQNIRKKSHDLTLVPYCEKETKGLEYHISVYHPEKSYEQNLQ